MRIISKAKDNLRDFLAVKNATDTRADLYFYGDIVSSWWGAWDNADQYPDAVREFLNEHKGRELHIYLNSGGGNVFAGTAIAAMLKRHDGHKVAHIDALAGSIASIIPFSCDEVRCPANAYFMLHKPYVDIEGNATELRKMAEDLDVIQSGMMQAYRAALKEGADEAAFAALVEEGTWLDGAKAAEWFNITVEPAKEYAARVSSDYLAACGVQLPDALKTAKADPPAEPEDLPPADGGHPDPDAALRDAIAARSIAILS